MTRNRPAAQTCGYCGQEFILSRRQRHCSRTCRLATARANPQRTPRPIINRAHTANSRARKLGLPGRITIADVSAVLNPGANCVYCGTLERLTIDHIVPLSAGGPNTRGNIQACCLSCNSSKSTVEEPWRWSLVADACVECGLTESPHHGNGVCNSCRQKHWRARRSEQYLAYTRRRQRERYAARKLRAAATRRQGAS